MSERDPAMQQDQQPAAGVDPAAGAPPSEAPPAAAPADADTHVEPDPALSGDDLAGPQGDPLAGVVLPSADRGDDRPAAVDPASAPGELDVEGLQARAAERDHYLALAQRAQADFENYRRRTAREAATAQERGAGRLAKELLPALDHLELALKAAEAEGGELFKGVRMVQDEMIGALGRAGIQPFAPAGERFDPNEHEAMVQRPVEGAEPGTVVEVYQQGYRINGVVLRPARVVVAA
jgi:molecular chaperone GrpE